MDIVNEEKSSSCGRVWRIIDHKTIMRDKDSLECTCGRTLLRWNGGTMYSKELIKESDEKKR